LKKKLLARTLSIIVITGGVLAHDVTARGQRYIFVSPTIDGGTVEDTVLVYNNKKISTKVNVPIETDMWKKQLPPNIKPVKTTSSTPVLVRSLTDEGDPIIADTSNDQILVPISPDLLYLVQAPKGGITIKVTTCQGNTAQATMFPLTRSGAITATVSSKQYAPISTGNLSGQYYTDEQKSVLQGVKRIVMNNSVIAAMKLKNPNERAYAVKFALDLNLENDNTLTPSRKERLGEVIKTIAETARKGNPVDICSYSNT
jgi:hypothetical protein